MTFNLQRRDRHDELRDALLELDKWEREELRMKRALDYTMREHAKAREQARLSRLAVDTILSHDTRSASQEGSQEVTA